MIVRYLLLIQPDDTGVMGYGCDTRVRPTDGYRCSVRSFNNSQIVRDTGDYRNLIQRSAAEELLLYVPLEATDFCSE